MGGTTTTGGGAGDQQSTPKVEVGWRILNDGVLFPIEDIMSLNKQWSQADPDQFWRAAKQNEFYYKASGGGGEGSKDEIQALLVFSMEKGRGYREGAGSAGSGSGGRSGGANPNTALEFYNRFANHDGIFPLGRPSPAAGGPEGSAPLRLPLTKFIGVLSVKEMVDRFVAACRNEGVSECLMPFAKAGQVKVPGGGGCSVARRVHARAELGLVGRK